MIPNYNENNTVNLMSSILHGLGGKSNYSQLNKELTKEIQKAKNVILLVLDGLGSDSLEKLGRESFLLKHKVQNLQSVFPSTTASAVTTFYTGLTPQEHSVTGWYMNMKEFGSVVTILRFMTRLNEPLKFDHHVSFLPKSIFEKIKVKSYNVAPEIVFKSGYNIFFCKKSHNIKYRTFNGFFNGIKKVIKSNKNKKYIYAYLPDFDSMSHKFGKDSLEAMGHLKEINKKIEKLAKQLSGTNTLILITADHGQIVTTNKKTIIANEHPKLMECLSAPLCGEPRAAYCYVYPRKVKQFEKYIKEDFKEYCDLYKSEELVKKGYFGSGKTHPRLLDRVGDYILIMKNSYSIKDFLINEEIKFKIGRHGGLSEEEMVVPLIKLNL